MSEANAICPAPHRKHPICLHILDWFRLFVLCIYEDIYLMKRVLDRNNLEKPQLRLKKMCYCALIFSLPSFLWASIFLSICTRQRILYMFTYIERYEEFQFFRGLGKTMALCRLHGIKNGDDYISLGLIFFNLMCDVLNVPKINVP